VVLDDQQMNLEAMKLLLLDFGYVGKIKGFTSSMSAIDFIMQFTIENKS